jgi:hypothetical protein
MPTSKKKKAFKDYTEFRVILLKNNIKDQSGLSKFLGLSPTSVSERFSKNQDWKLKDLLRMSKRAKTYEEICKERNFTASRFDGVNLYKPEEKFLSPQEFDKVFYEYLYSDKGFSYSRRTTLLNNEEEILKKLKNNQHIDFYVGKKYKK